MAETGANTFTGVWAALLLFFVVGWAVNKIAKRPLMNWAAWFAGYMALSFGLVIIVVARGAADAEYLGYHVGAYLLPALVAGIYSRQWRRKRTKSAIDSSS